jgi:hypothetical protein
MSNIETPYIRRGHWPEDRAKAVKEWWLQGISGGAIADRLGNGIKRGAVIGFLNRQGLLKNSSRDVAILGKKRGPKKSSSSKTKRDRVKAAAARMAREKNAIKKKEVAFLREQILLARKKKEQLRAEYDASARAVTFEELKDHHCRWVWKEDGKFMYCGCARVERSSYCEKHHRVVYTPVQRRKKT